MRIVCDCGTEIEFEEYTTDNIPEEFDANRQDYVAGRRDYAVGIAYNGPIEVGISHIREYEKSGPVYFSVVTIQCRNCGKTVQVHTWPFDPRQEHKKT